MIFIVRISDGEQLSGFYRIFITVKIFNSMKRMIMSAMAAIVAMTCIAACGNAGAKNNKKTDEVTTGNVVELTAETFNTLVYNTKADNQKYLGNKPAIVDFNATWCGPCQRIAPILEELAAEYKDKIVIYKVDVDKCRDIALEYGVSSIPALMFIPMKGEPVMTVGARDKAKFKSEIDNILLNSK